jgi:tRNA pseudouridine55 synthase
MSGHHPPPSAPGGPPPASGLLLVDKPYRLSSMSICRVVKRRLMNAGYPKSIKVGHGGTLDPLASGLMVILVGRATKQCDRVMAGEKRYAAEIDLGHTSTTDDLEGQLAPVAVESPPTRQVVDRVLGCFLGLVEQRPPAHSAIWVSGERAYDLARAGTPPQMALRPVMVHSIGVVEYSYPRLVLDIRCGKGTYIRSMARDIGAALGTGGCLAGLRRTAVGEFTIEQAIPLDDVPDPLTADRLIPVP